MSPKAKSMRLETQLGGILNLTLTVESQNQSSFNKFLSYSRKKASFDVDFVVLLTKS